MKTSTRFAKAFLKNWFEKIGIGEYRFNIEINSIKVILNLKETEMIEWWIRVELHYHIYNDYGNIQWSYNSNDLWSAWVVRIVKRLIDIFEKEIW